MYGFLAEANCCKSNNKENQGGYHGAEKNRYRRKTSAQFQNKYKIAREELAAKGELFLNPPAGVLGIRGFEKFVKELPDYVNNKAIVRPTAAEMDTDLYDDKK